MAFREKLAETGRQIDAWLAVELARDRDVPERLAAAMRHACLGGGKRFRPLLVLESARLFGIPAVAAAGTAIALECVHGYSLVHDDLPAMDNDRLRRGQPTVWAQFDEWTAILAGDALLTRAFEILARAETHPDPAVRMELVVALARASGAAGMVGGQCLDLDADKRGEPAAPTIPHLTRLQAMKTGALITFACEAGAILGRADAVRRAALVSYGRAIGLAFQMSDDLLDAEGDAEVVGKAVAKDAAAGKATWVGLLGVEETRRRLAEAERAAIDSLAIFGPAAATLIEAARFVSGRDR